MIQRSDYTKEAYQVLCKAAISGNWRIIKELDSSVLNEDLCLFAIHRGCSIHDISHDARTTNVYIAYAEKSVDAFDGTILIYDETKVDVHLALAAVNPFMWMVCACKYTRVRARSLKTHLAAVEKDGLAIRFALGVSGLAGAPTVLVKAAIKQNPLAIVHAPSSDPQLCLDCYQRNKNTFALFNDKGRLYVARRVLADLMMALAPLDLSSNLLSEVCESLLCPRTGQFPKTYVDAPSPGEVDAERHLLETRGWIPRNRSRDVSAWNMSIYDIWTLMCHVRKVWA